MSQKIHRPKKIKSIKVEFEKRGILGSLTKPFKKIINKKKAVANELENMLSCIKNIKDLKDDEEFKDHLFDLNDELTQALLTKIFTSLKESGLINPIIKFSLTDDKVRQGIIDLTIQLLEADVIPYYEIFVALRDSGLAIDVIKFLLTDPKVRKGEIDLVLELIPRLIDEKVINVDDLIKRIPQLIPRIEIPSGIPRIDIPKLSFHLPIKGTASGSATVSATVSASASASSASSAAVTETIESTSAKSTANEKSAEKSTKATSASSKTITSRDFQTIDLSSIGLGTYNTTDLDTAMATINSFDTTFQATMIPTTLLTDFAVPTFPVAGVL